MKKFVMKISDNSLLVCLVLILLATLFRIPHITGSFWLDEAAQALESNRPLADQLSIARDFQPPLIHYIVHFASRISTTEWWLRIWGALIPGITSIVATYLIGKELKYPKAGLLAALFLATNSFHIYFSQELRPYALPTGLALLSFLFLIKATKQPKMKWFIWFTVVNALGLYSSYLYPFLLFAQVVIVLTQQRKQLTAFAISYIFAGVSFLPWIPKFLEQLAVGQALQKTLPGWSEVVSITQLKALPLVFFKLWYGLGNLELNVYYVLTSLLLFCLSIFLLIKTPQLKKFLLANKMLLIWSTVPLLTSWLLSFYVPVVRPKRLLFLLPAWYLLFSVFLETTVFKKKSLPINKKIANLLIALIFFINLAGTISYYTQPQLQREPWRQVYQDIQADYSPRTTAVVFAFTAPLSPWDWYAGKTYQTISTGYLVSVPQPLVNDKLKGVFEYETILVFDYLRDLTDPERKIDTALQQYGYTEGNVLDYPNIGFIRVYFRPEALLS